MYLLMSGEVGAGGPLIKHTSRHMQVSDQSINLIRQRINVPEIKQDCSDQYCGVGTGPARIRNYLLERRRIQNCCENNHLRMYELTLHCKFVISFLK